ncbi:UdgX family uracil-DNA binding protein [Bordetella sp. BOR01]|uniref:UdgX family uracil-DNA binding protein n=1 Tax=Bordetella sp. BOR01 TaxID=2854779 RepID=UPI001C45A7BD|nr:UdgX family uracil-DNA binding protein [Bordetella sp. BOR01]MBV7482646.1 UdgX family uracil-DNA binding protein [Bordetella sp. BOR01]
MTRDPADTDPGQHPQRLQDCRRCGLWRDATQAVAGEGRRSAHIMLVGEQPGDKEDLAGQPFVGPAGALLDRALRQAGVQRTSVYITNAVKHFKWQARGKRRMHKTPAQREIEACHYWLEDELRAIRPRVVVALGATALHSVMQAKSVALTPVLGQVLEHDGLAVIPTYHPSFALRAPDAQARQRAFDAIVDALAKAGRM